MSGAYVLRAYVYEGMELPAPSAYSALLGGRSARKVSVGVSIGTYSMQTSSVTPVNRHATWNQQLYSYGLTLPHDLTQRPDLFVFLRIGDRNGDGRVVAFRRIRASSLIGGDYRKKSVVLRKIDLEQVETCRTDQGSGHKWKRTWNFEV